MARAAAHPLAEAREAEALAALAARARACRKCIEAPARDPLPHAPRPLFSVSETARICIASQAPGIRAHMSGVPFDDPSGARLRAWLGVTAAEFYDAARIAIVPMGFCFPGQDAKGGDLPPRRECAPTWRASFFALMPRMELILCVGRHAAEYHLNLPRNASATPLIQEWKRILEGAETPIRLPLPHPSWRNAAWLQRNPWFAAELLPVLQREVRRRLS